MNKNSFLYSRALPADSPLVHILSASCAGFAASTATNPIWFVKTRLQLDQNSKSQMSVTECIRKIYKTSGLIGFYKGITASYVGISETVIHFVIYEALKSKIVSEQVVDLVAHPCLTHYHVDFPFTTFSRLNLDKLILAMVKHLVTFWNLCYLVPFRKRLHRV